MPALPTLCHGWEIVSRPNLVASAAGEAWLLELMDSFASRDIAPCCARKRRPVFRSQAVSVMFVLNNVC